MKFQFSIGEAVSACWHMFWRHSWFFIGMAFVTFLLSTFSRHHGILLTILVLIAQILWGYVFINASIAAADGKEEVLRFKSLSSHMPDFRQFLMIVAISIVVGLIVIAGLVLLIVPGLYFGVRLVFAKYAYIDHQGSFKQSLERSWHLVKGKIFWTVVLVGLVEIGILLLGVIAVIVGLLVAYPITVLVFGRLYRALDTHYRSTVESQTVQPA